MQGHQNSFVASEGLPYLLATLGLCAMTWHFLGALFVAPLLVLFVWLFLIFRDPSREVPAVPLGVVSPVDGVVLAVSLTDSSVLGGEAQKVTIAVDSFGTYTARCPIEGKIMDLCGEAEKSRLGSNENGLWVRTDEDDDVILQFAGHRFGLAPRAFLRFGERVGQGQRCAFLRLTRRADVQLPLAARIQVEEGQRVSAGSDLLAKLPPSH